MAHDPAVKAQTVIDLSNGASIGEAARRNKVPKGTVQKWAEEMKPKAGITPAENKLAIFHEKVAQFAISTMEMLESQALLLTDHGYLSKQDTQDVIAHTKFIRDSFTGIVRLQSSLAATGTVPSESEIVRAEIVDA